MKPLRVVTVPYVNIEPFLRGLAEVFPCEVSRARPCDLPRARASGRFDLCMLSSVDLLRLELLPLAGASISSDGPVGSVLLTADEPPGRWRKVALDAASSTSARLARVLVSTLCGEPPEFFTTVEADRALRRGCDAALVIGDRALRCRPRRVHLDLGEAWRAIAGRPFVYAAWAAGPGCAIPVRDLEDVLRGAGEASRRHAARTAVERAAALEVTSTRLLRYFTEEISYAFGARELQGLAMFRDLLEEDDPCAWAAPAVATQSVAGGAA